MKFLIVWRVVGSDDLQTLWSDDYDVDLRHLSACKRDDCVISYSVYVAGTPIDSGELF